jgi:DNA-binding SARP family transcriptional activator/TolB-like protein
VVELRLFGTLEIRDSDGRDHAALARQSKRAALLVYLAAAAPHGLHRRETLLALFWPDLSESRARAALSQALHVLRATLGEEVIVTRGDDEVGLAAGVVRCDVTAFETALEAGRLEEALGLYGADMLPGFSLSDAPDFGRWLDRERDRLRTRAAEGAWIWAEARAKGGDPTAAVHWARWAAALAPADEGAIRRLMTILARQGDRAAALQAYEAFTRTLSEEFDLEPSAATRALADSMRAGPGAAGVADPGRSPGAAPAAPGPYQVRGRRPAVIGAVAGAALVIILGLRVLGSRGQSGAPEPASRRIAVLPLANLTGDSAQGYFVDGMHEALIDELAKLKGVSVISRTSVLQFRGASRLSLPAIERRLEVDGVVEGSVFRAKDSVRVAVQLIDGRTDQPIWSETYVRDARDVLRLFSELATEVATQVRAAVTPDERSRLAGVRQVDPEVYTLTFKGGEACLLWTRDGYRRGVQLLRDALERDPTYSLAYARLAGCYLDMSFFGFMPDSEATPLATAATGRALELDSTLGEGYLNRAWIRYVYDHDREGADQDFRRALQLSPGSVRIRQWYADYLQVQGRFDEAIDQRHHAIGLDPLAATSNIGLGSTYFWARRYDDAIAQFKRTVNLAPGSVGAHWQLSWNYSLRGRHREAVQECDSAMALTPAEERDSLALCGFVYTRAGRRGRVLEMLRRNPGSCGNSADLYVALGDLDHALSCLRKETRENPQDLALNSFNPIYDPLREDAKYHARLLALGIAP